MNSTFNINRTALAVSLALGSISAVAAPAKFTANTGVAPNAYVTSTYLHNTNDCGFTCYGNYITEFPSMNDAGVIVGAAKNNLAYVAPKPPIYEPAPKAGGSGGVSVGIAAAWENGQMTRPAFPLLRRSSSPTDYDTFNDPASPLAGRRIYEKRGCRDGVDNYPYGYITDGIADNSFCGSRAVAINNNGLIAGAAHAFPVMDTPYFERGVLWGTDFANTWKGVANTTISSPLWSKTTVYPLNQYATSQQDTVTAINEKGSTVGNGIALQYFDTLAHGMYTLSNFRKNDYIGVPRQKSSANGINNNDSITGVALFRFANGTFGTPQAYVFKNTEVEDPITKVVSITSNFTSWGEYPGAHRTEGYDINDSDLVVGRAINAAGQTRAFYWQSPGGAVTDLDTLGGNFAVARSVNNKGNIVGSSQNALGENRGFIYLWAEKKMYDLNTYISNVQSGWTIVDAYTINEKGEVLVRAVSSAGSAYWTLRPNGIDQAATIAAAELVSPNAKVTAAVGSAGDNDYFKIVLPIDGTFTVYTTGTSDTYCHLLNNAGTQLTINDNTSTTNNNCRISAYRTAGTYYARIRHASATGTGNYTFLSTFVADDGDVKDAGTQVEPVSSTAAKIDASGDVDFFTVYLDAGKTLTVKTTGTTNTYCALQSTDGTQIVANDNASATDTNCSLSRLLNSPGIYHVMVRHGGTGTGGYNLEVQ